MRSKEPFSWSRIFTMQLNPNRQCGETKPKEEMEKSEQLHSFRNFKRDILSFGHIFFGDAVFFFGLNIFWTCCWFVVCVFFYRRDETRHNKPLWFNLDANINSVCISPWNDLQVKRELWNDITNIYVFFLAKNNMFYVSWNMEYNLFSICLFSNIYRSSFTIDLTYCFLTILKIDGSKYRKLWRRKRQHKTRERRNKKR